MRFMVIVKATKESESGVLPDEKELAAMGKFNEELVKAGVMLAGEGLHPSSKGVRISFGAAARGRSSTARSPRPRSWSPATGCCRRRPGRSASSG